MFSVGQVTVLLPVFGLVDVEAVELGVGSKMFFLAINQV